MKQIWPNYSYSPTTNVLTLTGLNIDRDQLLLVTAADRGRIMYNFADSSVTASAFTSGANTALTLVATTAGLTTTAALIIYYDDQLQSTSVSISNFPASQTIAGTVTANVGNATSLVGGGYPTITDLLANETIAVRELPAISGTVTANAGGDFANSIESVNDVSNVTKKIAVQLYDDNGSAVGVSNNPLPISGTVTLGASAAQIGSVTASISGTVPVSGTFWQATQPVSGTFWQATQPASLASLPALAAGTAQIGSVTASISNSVTIASLPAISGTVTANSSNGSLTTRFGSVTTANTAFATSAVTNASRKYLLIQNVTTASNVITVGIGFTPTTTQGIQLSSGAGLTFEGSYIPTGAVNLLSSVTASCFTILEA